MAALVPVVRRAGPSAAETGGAAGVSVVPRVIGLLRCLAGTQGSVAIKDLAGELKLTPSTLYRLLDQFIKAGMIKRVPRSPLPGKPRVQPHRCACYPRDQYAAPGPRGTG
jgi:hypothetical protein